jgi:hypothetical protein
LRSEVRIDDDGPTAGDWALVLAPVQPAAEEEGTPVMVNPPTGDLASNMREYAAM